MAEEKFNPIAQIPTLPGTNITIKDLDANTVDSTYPPLTEKEKNAEPEVEVKIKPAQTEEKTEESKEEKRATLVRIGVIVSLIVLVFAGIILTLQLVPKVISGVSNLTSPFGAFFVPSKTATTTTKVVPSYVPATTTVVVTPKPTPTVVSTSTVIKAPARLLVNINKTYQVGNQTFVRFNIQNVGYTTSGTWSFSVALPSNISPIYNSVAQAPLTPKSGVIYNLGFIATENRPFIFTLHTPNGDIVSNGYGY